MDEEDHPYITDEELKQERQGTSLWMPRSLWTRAFVQEKFFLLTQPSLSLTVETTGSALRTPL